MPAVDHDLVDCSWTAWWRGQSIAQIKLLNDLINNDCESLDIKNFSCWFISYLPVLCCSKWLLPKTPYLIEQTAIAPDITGSGVLSVVQSLWCCPLERDSSTFGYVVVVFSQVNWHPKISDLREQWVKINYNARLSQPRSKCFTFGRNLRWELGKLLQAFSYCDSWYWPCKCLPLILGCFLQQDLCGRTLLLTNIAFPEPLVGRTQEASLGWTSASTALAYDKQNSCK